MMSKIKQNHSKWDLEVVFTFLTSEIKAVLWFMAGRGEKENYSEEIRDKKCV